MNLAHAKACYDGKGIPLRKCEPRGELTRAWIDATLAMVRKQECLAAGSLDGGVADPSPHPAVYEASELVAGAAHFLDDPKPTPERAALVAVVEKYLGNLALMYDRDGDAPKIALLRGIVEEARAPAPVAVSE